MHEDITVSAAGLPGSSAWRKKIQPDGGARVPGAGGILRAFRPRRPVTKAMADKGG
jgi:hypothetical protein